MLLSNAIDNIHYLSNCRSAGVIAFMGLMGNANHWLPKQEVLPRNGMPILVEIDCIGDGL